MNILNSLIWWIGVLHIAAYTLAGASFGASLFVGWLIERTGNQKDVILALKRIYDERYKARGGRIPG